MRKLLIILLSLLPVGLSASRLLAAEPLSLLDITDRAALEAFVGANKIDLIVNCAAYTNVDKAEEDEPTARLINALAVENIGSLGTKVIHISTDYVFLGEGSVP